MLKLNIPTTGADFEGFRHGFFVDSSHSPSHPSYLFGVLRWRHGGASHFSCCSTLLHLDHRPEEKEIEVLVNH